MMLNVNISNLISKIRSWAKYKEYQRMVNLITEKGFLAENSFELVTNNKIISKIEKALKEQKLTQTFSHIREGKYHYMVLYDGDIWRCPQIILLEKDTLNAVYRVIIKDEDDYDEDE